MERRPAMIFPPSPRLLTTTPKTWPLTSRTRCPGTFSVVTTSTAPPQGLQMVVVGYPSRLSLARNPFPCSRLTIAVREKPRFALHHPIQVNVLGFAERIEPFGPELTTYAAVAHTPKRRRVIVGQGIVDPEGTRLDRFHGGHRCGEIFGVNRSAQAILGIVG